MTQMNDAGLVSREYADDFSIPLARHFASVECRNTGAYTLWETRATLQAYLDAFVEMIGAVDAPEEPYPFRVTRRNRVYAADKT